jgi:hypothetical protein
MSYVHAKGAKLVMNFREKIIHNSGFPGIDIFKIDAGMVRPYRKDGTPGIHGNG